MARFHRFKYTIQEETDLPVSDIPLTAEQQIQSILQKDNHVLGNKVQSFEREFDKTWERVAVDVQGNIATLSPLFPHLQSKLEHTRKQQQQIEAILNAAAATTTNPTSTSTTPTLTNTTIAPNSTLPTTLANKHGVIRSVCLVVDLSESSLEKDIRPTRFDFLTNIAGQFISSFIDQHPLSELTSLSIAQGHCKLLTGIRQPKTDYIEALKGCQSETELKGGVFSIQNTIHSCGHLLQSAPPQACKEIVILTCSLNTVDVKDIEDTIAYCIQQDITVNIVGLDASVRIFDRICSTTGGTYTIACDSTQFYNGLFHHLKAPIKQKKHTTRGWIQVGFPSVKTATLHKRQIQNNNNNNSNSSKSALLSTLICLCHNQLRERVYMCPTCSATVCQIPNQCPICKTLLLSYPLLAQSASQLHIPPPTIPAHFNPALLPLRELFLAVKNSRNNNTNITHPAAAETTNTSNNNTNTKDNNINNNIMLDDDIDVVLKSIKRANMNKLRFKKKKLDEGGSNQDPLSNTMGNIDDGIQYVDDGPSITKDTTDDAMVSIESLTFSKNLTTIDVVKGVQIFQKQQQQSSDGIDNNNDPTAKPNTNTTSNNTMTPNTNLTYPQHYAVQSSSAMPQCQSLIVHCQGCTTPLILPTTKLLESALCYTNDVTNIVICSCNVCKNTDLVTTCSICGCFLCHDCDELTQTMLQNCPGCFSSH